MLLVDVFRGGSSLVRVGETHLEHIVPPCDGHAAGSIRETAQHIRGGGGGGQFKDVVCIRFTGDRETRCGRDGAEQHLHAPVLQGIVRVDGFFRVVYVILEIEGELESAHCIDLLDRDFRAVLDRDAVNRRIPRGRTNAADADGALRLLRRGAAGKGKRERRRHQSREYSRYDFLHFHIRYLLCLDILHSVCYNYIHFSCISQDRLTYAVIIFPYVYCTFIHFRVAN